MGPGVVDVSVKSREGQSKPRPDRSYEHVGLGSDPSHETGVRPVYIPVRLLIKTSHQSSVTVHCFVPLALVGVHPGPEDPYLERGENRRVKDPT